MDDTGEFTGLRWDVVECGISRVVGETEDELINDAMDGDNTDRLGGNWSWDMEGSVLYDLPPFVFPDGHNGCAAPLVLSGALANVHALSLTLWLDFHWLKHV